ncbi:acyltransferase family protein [sulfur-oxidizing endosymbiont of Gigantopelta aegis]|uniref:acyltransferase family protein n=1 Tax=sulfur-oxidizing endosymbiont of Gigantopelta aegis TaxID=2794934 RepID=UPI0018DAFD02|nr:acyltransferase family protein [sulfur-oxidizing endosymbiont of Gigantopelta aegis]
MKLKRKLLWGETLKVVAIFSVILGHIASPFGQFIFSWHMPLFFMISGFFLKLERPLQEAARKDFKRLMIPYFIFSLIGLAVEILKRLILHREELDVFIEIKGILFSMDMSGLMNHYGLVLWFLPALFFSRLFVLVLYKITHKILYVFILSMSLFSASFYIDLPFAIDNACNAMLWILLGYIYFNYYQNSKWLNVFPLLALGVFVLYGFPSLDIANKNYSYIPVNFVWATAFIGSLCLLLKNTSMLNALSPLGKYTMLLFIFHPYTNNIAYIVLEKLNFNVWYITFFFSLSLLSGLILIKMKFYNKGIFKYV